MAGLPKFDSEVLLLAVKKQVTDYFNAQLLTINTEKNDGITMKPLDSGAIDMLSKTPGNYSSDPFMIIKLLNKQPIQGMGQGVAEIAVLVSMLDPMDLSAETRMLRYQRALEEIFAPEEGNKIGIASISSSELLPYLDTPDFMQNTKRRLTWGLRLRFTW